MPEAIPAVEPGVDVPHRFRSYQLSDVSARYPCIHSTLLSCPGYHEMHEAKSKQNGSISKPRSPNIIFTSLQRSPWKTSLLEARFVFRENNGAAQRLFLLRNSIIIARYILSQPAGTVLNKKLIWGTWGLYGSGICSSMALGSRNYQIENFKYYLSSSEK